MKRPSPLLFLTLLLLASSALPAQSLSFDSSGIIETNSFVNDSTLVVKELSDCEKADLAKAQKAYDSAATELKRVKEVIQFNYEGRVVNKPNWNGWNSSYCAPYKVARVVGKYVYITDSSPSCGGMVFANSAVLTTSH